MRRAFVLQLGLETHTSQRHFEGWIEEVDTGKELRFKSTDELLTFLAQCADAARPRDLVRDEQGDGREDS